MKIGRMSGEEKLNHYLKSKLLDGIKINKNVEKILINIMNIKTINNILYEIENNGLCRVRY